MKFSQGSRDVEQVPLKPWIILTTDPDKEKHGRPSGRLTGKKGRDSSQSFFSDKSEVPLAF